MGKKVKVIGLCGFAGSGKGTVGEILVEEHGFVKLSFAKRLKDCVSHLFNWDRELLEGVTKESREWREKADPFWTSEFGFEVTPRLILQKVGTECMRFGLHDDIWISMVKKYVLDNPNNDYVITDVRFRNEQVMIRSMGGYVWQVRKGEMPEWFEIAKTNDLDPSIIENKYNVHQSEFKWIDEDSKFETIIENDGTIDDLKIKVREEIKSMSNETHNAYRCAKTGRFVKESYAKENPYTTIKVRVPNPGKSLIKKDKK